MVFGVWNRDELALCRQVFRHWSGLNGIIETLPSEDLAWEILQAHNAGATTYAKLVAAITTRTGEAWYFNAIDCGPPVTSDRETRVEF